MEAGELLENLTLFFSVFWIICRGQGWERSTRYHPDLLAEAQDITLSVSWIKPQSEVWNICLPSQISCVMTQAPGVIHELTLMRLLCVPWAAGQGCPFPVPRPFGNTGSSGENPERSKAESSKQPLAPLARPRTSCAFFNFFEAKCEEWLFSPDSWLPAEQAASVTLQ